MLLRLVVGLLMGLAFAQQTQDLSSAKSLKEATDDSEKLIAVLTPLLSKAISLLEGTSLATSGGYKKHRTGSNRYADVEDSKTSEEVDDHTPTEEDSKTSEEVDDHTPTEEDSKTSVEVDDHTPTEEDSKTSVEVDDHTATEEEDCDIWCMKSDGKFYCCKVAAKANEMAEL